MPFFKNDELSADKVVARNPYSRLMYYIHCINNLINLNTRYPTVKRFSDFSNCDLDQCEIKELYRLCRFLHPENLYGKCLLKSTPTSQKPNNLFISISVITYAKEETPDVVIEGNNFKVKQFMACSPEWESFYYLHPMWALATMAFKMSQSILHINAPAIPPQDLTNSILEVSIIGRMNGSVNRISPQKIKQSLSIPPEMTNLELLQESLSNIQLSPDKGNLNTSHLSLTPKQLLNANEVDENILPTSREVEDMLENNKPPKKPHFIKYKKYNYLYDKLNWIYLLSSVIYFGLLIGTTYLYVKNGYELWKVISLVFDCVFCLSEASMYYYIKKKCIENVSFRLYIFGFFFIQIVTCIFYLVEYRWFAIATGVSLLLFFGGVLRSCCTTQAM